MVTGEVPRVSVVIPTHNRLPILRQCLSALATQQYPRERMEVIVVADGCTDGTVAQLAAEPPPVPIRVIAQPPSGAAAARNRGADAARGEILLFLDDDVVASEALVAAHAQVHSRQGERVVVGPYLLDPPVGTDYLQEALSGFWRRLFEGMAIPGRNPQYKDFVSGNLSIRKETFLRINGFSEEFPGCGVEDYELGVRLLGAGVEWRFAPEARARHLETTELGRSLARNRRGGAATVTLVRLHPSLLPTTALTQATGASRWLAFHAPRSGRVVSAIYVRLLGGAERLRLERVWRALYGQLRSYWFWCGVRDEIGSEGDLEEFLAGVLSAERPSETPGRGIRQTT